ncbi:unnamed protein product [Arabis nemorensis]|uniref:Zinc knuckle CX2CX4HX4C domain-containing protein n=1 Tax=Arabis nemorensis TaxID=586526 RepID=A0A565BHZ8_9BRAS|nr:unnamed protein product [Arabis nemorensis]
MFSGLSMTEYGDAPPPSNFLKEAPVWIWIHKILVNYFTLNTIKAIGKGIRHVKEVAYDPEKPHLQDYLQDYVRVLVVINLDQPVRDTKVINISRGQTATVDVEYERIRKKCFHCLRLTQDKQRCPLFQGKKQTMIKENEKTSQLFNHRKNTPKVHTNLAEKLMPLLAPKVPHGFEPSSSVVPKVFQQIKIYMSCLDPQERRIREQLMIQTLNELSKDLIAQSSRLRLEAPPLVSSNLNKDKGKVYDFSKTQLVNSQGTHNAELTTKGAEVLSTEEGYNIQKAALTSLTRPELTIQKVHQQQEGSGKFIPEADNLVFNMGVTEASSSGISGRSINIQQRTSSWSRKKRNISGRQRAQQTQENEDGDTNA